MKRSSRAFSRRALLAAGAGASLLPLVPLLEAQGAADTYPKRLLFLYSSNGTVHEKWVPTMSNGSLVLSEILQPLEPYKSDLLVVDGLGYNSASKGDKDGHFGGMNAALTGASNKIVDPNDPDQNSLALGVSVDQYIATAIGGTTKFRSLQSGIQVDTYSPTVAALSYQASMQPMMPENDPYKVYDRVFGSFAPPGSTVDPKLQQALLDRKSVLDFVGGELTGLKPKLSAGEQQKIDAHLSAIREIERGLSAPPSSRATDSCKVPVQSTKLDIWKNDNIPALAKLQMDLLVMAMACDLTRVGTIQFGRAGAQHRLSWLGPEFLSDPNNGPNDSTSGIHGLAHNEANPDSRVKLAKCHQWYATQVNYLVGRLKAIPEGGGSMFDNSLVVWMNEMGTGSHRLDKTPWVIAGGAGFFKTGQLVSFPGEPHNRLLASLCEAMGLQDEKFGDADFAKAPLTGVT